MERERALAPLHFSQFKVFESCFTYIFRGRPIATPARFSQTISLTVEKGVAPGVDDDGSNATSPPKMRFMYTYGQSLRLNPDVEV